MLLFFINIMYKMIKGVFSLLIILYNYNFSFDMNGCICVYFLLKCGFPEIINIQTAVICPSVI